MAGRSRPPSLRRSAAECVPGRSAAIPSGAAERRRGHSAAERRNEGTAHAAPSKTAHAAAPSNTEASPRTTRSSMT